MESVVPCVVEEAGRFAGFRDEATKTITPLERLEALTLPALDDVGDGLAGYREAVERATELAEKIERTDALIERTDALIERTDALIERTDALIDQIVYDLYGLTDEERDCRGGGRGSSFSTGGQSAQSERNSTTSSSPG